MTEEPDNRELEKRIELLKKDIKIMEANIDKTLEAMRTDIAQGHKDAAKRETRLILTMVGLVIGGIAILGFILN